MEEKLVSTVHTFVGKMSNTLRSWWRRGRDDHLDAAGVVAGRLVAALELSSEAAEAAVVRRRRSSPPATGKDDDGQTSDRRPKLRPKHGRGVGHVETWFGRDGRGLRGEEAAEE